MMSASSFAALMRFRSDYCGVAALSFRFDHHALIETLFTKKPFERNKRGGS
jgi:hypothetical protein